MPDLFNARPWLLTAAGDAPRDLDACARLEEWVSALGARPRRMSAEEHDRVMAALSHLPQVVASSLMQVVGEAAGAESLALAGRGLRDTTRLASSPGDVWSDVWTTNHDMLVPLIDGVIAQLRALRDDPTGDALRKLFIAAQGWRAALDASDTR